MWKCITSSFKSVYGHFRSSAAEHIPGIGLSPLRNKPCFHPLSRFWDYSSKSKAMCFRCVSICLQEQQTSYFNSCSTVNEEENSSTTTQWKNLDNSVPAANNNNCDLLHLCKKKDYFDPGIFRNAGWLQKIITWLWVEVLGSVDIFSISFSSSSLSICCLNGSIYSNNKKIAWELLQLIVESSCRMDLQMRWTVSMLANITIKTSYFKALGDERKDVKFSLQRTEGTDLTDCF